MHVVPALASAALIWLIFKGQLRSVYAPLLLFTLVTSAVTLFQMRGTQYAVPVAAMALSVIITRFAEQGGRRRPLLLLGAMMASCVLYGGLLSAPPLHCSAMAKPARLIASGKPEPSEQCHSPASLASLNALPAGLVAGSSNFGPLFLLSTNHRALSGPYHRNVEGNLAWINAMTGSPDEARFHLESAKVTISGYLPG